MNKNKVMALSVLSILAVALVSALAYNLVLEGDVNKSFDLNGVTSGTFDISGGENVSTGVVSAMSNTDSHLPLAINTQYSSSNLTEGDNVMTYPVYHLKASNSEEVGKVVYDKNGIVARESTFSVLAKDAGVETLSDLETMSWEAFVQQGYIPHVDIMIDLDDDGSADDALVVEYDKVDTPSDQKVSDMNYNRDAWVNTFDDKGMVDNNSRLWLSSGAPGALDSQGFIDGTLSEWKSGTAENASITGNTKVIAFEVEVDNWIEDSTAKVRNVSVNGNPVTVSVNPQDTLDFEVVSRFGLGVTESNLEITHSVEPAREFA